MVRLSVCYGDDRHTMNIYVNQCSRTLYNYKDAEHYVQ